MHTKQSAAEVAELGSVQIPANAEAAQWPRFAPGKRSDATVGFSGQPEPEIARFLKSGARAGFETRPKKTQKRIFGGHFKLARGGNWNLRLVRVEVD